MNDEMGNPTSLFNLFGEGFLEEFQSGPPMKLYYHNLLNLYALKSAQSKTS
jgi:hypothetical protein